MSKPLADRLEFNPQQDQGAAMDSSMEAPAGSRFPLKRLITMALGLGIIAILFATVGTGQVLDVLSRTNRVYLALALLCFVPQFIVIGWRWSRMTRPFQRNSLGECVRLVLATNTANVVLPSKLGDFGKALVLSRSGRISLPSALGLVVLEKSLDLGALALYMILGTSLLLLGAGGGLSPLHQGAALSASALGLAVIGGLSLILLAPVPRFLGSPEGTGIGSKLVRVALGVKDGLQTLRTHGAPLPLLLASTATIWGLHLLQIWLFFLCVGAIPDLGRFLCLAPLAIFIGLVPLTFGGFGQRDAAFIALFAPIPEATMLAAALMVNTRYVIPALVGWPFFHRYAVRSL